MIKLDRAAVILREPSLVRVDEPLVERRAASRDGALRKEQLKGSLQQKSTTSSFEK